MNKAIRVRVIALLVVRAIIHGTNKDAWENHIQHKGLNIMNRNHIHVSDFSAEQ